MGLSDQGPPLDDWVPASWKPLSGLSPEPRNSLYLGCRIDDRLGGRVVVEAHGASGLIESGFSILILCGG